MGWANIFLSFTYLDNFIGMVDAIECFMETKSLPKETTFFWLDVFVNDKMGCIRQGGLGHLGRL